MAFWIDGELVGAYVHSSSGEASYSYHALVYKNEELNPEQHTFMLSNGQINGPQAAILFDYIVYT